MFRTNFLSRKALAAISAALLCFSFSAAGQKRLVTPNLTFEVNETADKAAFILNDKPNAASRDADFWRLILDDSLRTEIPVVSKDQIGKVVEKDGKLIITYDEVKSEYGDTYPISFKLVVEVEDGLLKFTPEVTNNAEKIRVNECFAPMADFTELYGKKSQDVLYLPNGLGKREKNPWSSLKSLTAQYYNHDEREAFIHLPYPRATMAWYGVESGDKFLYVARPDDKFRHCFLTIHQTLHQNPTNMLVGTDHFPMAKTGETVDIPPTVIGVLDGDFREGAKTYRRWAEKTFWKDQPKEDWVKEMTGWQRIIMRSQYGEDYYTAEDLPRIYENGKKYGINTIFLFAWWKEGMDRGYPYYNEPYPGAYKALAENIKKVQDMGGRIMMECNCHFLDPGMEYYKEHGEYLCITDINGNEYRPSFVYPGRGEFRVTYGKVQFPLCCAGTEMWRNQVVDQLKMMGDMGADCVFADCYGGNPTQPCFNSRHEHGNRVDEEWIYHRQFFDKALEYTNENDKVLACEVVTDIAASYCQFIHGLVNVDGQVNGDAYPAMFRYTFPEVITTERGIRCPEGDFAKRLKVCLVSGLRLDAELYVCRADLGRDPKYAEQIGMYTSNLDKYGEFYYDGTYTVIDTSELPLTLKRGEYLSKDGKRVMRVLYNGAKESAKTAGIKLGPDELRYDIFDTEEYVKKFGK